MTSSISSNTTSLTPFTKIGSDASMQALSFLDYPDLFHFFRTSQDALVLREKNKQQLERTLFSRIEIFDRTKWKECWGVEITDQFDPRKIDVFVLRDFLGKYYGPNPIDPSRLVKDTCLIPTVVPVKVNDKGKNRIYNLVVLGALAQRPGQLEQQAEQKRYYSAKYWADDCEDGEIGAEKDCLVILLQDVVARNRSWSREADNPNKRGQIQVLRDMNTRTHYGCETEPDALSQNTVLFAHHAVTGKRPFGDSSGMEGRQTYGRTREMVLDGQNGYHMISGNFKAGHIGSVGGVAPAVLGVFNDCSLDNEPQGVGVLRKF